LLTIKRLHGIANYCLDICTIWISDKNHSFPLENLFSATECLAKLPIVYLKNYKQLLYELIIYEQNPRLDDREEKHPGNMKLLCETI